MRFDALIISCEHASNRVPAAFRSAFRGAGAALATHRGSDIGAAPVARALARRFGSRAFLGSATRLLVDLNRSLHNRTAWSEWSQPLPAPTKNAIVARYYTPYRSDVDRAISAHTDAGRRVLHVSVHSFTPELAGVRRVADIGLLYDPSHARERALCAAWKSALTERAPDLRIRRNYPYHGAHDGLVRDLRAGRSARRYTAVEIEMNQAIVAHGAGQRRMVTLLGGLVAEATLGPGRG